MIELTPTERRIHKAILRGLTSKEVALRLGVAPRTIEFHRANILRKFGVRSMAQLFAGRIAELEAELLRRPFAPQNERP